ncbi:protein ACCELERATED CELL DEATH 6-like [Daucus carota subsp. sativus]|uniref:protein ACCELERATED CELL DEATH 6-like n=1 Tax=Daucus carota subsp. sativus TaxID=79200 RepID=UPI003083298C
MSLLDLKVEHRVRNRQSAILWKERLRRLKSLKDPRTSTPITNAAESIGIQQQQIMDLELWEAAKNGDVDNFITCLEIFSKYNDAPLSTIFSQLTFPGQDTFLHVAAGYGHEDLVSFIVNHFFELVTCRNHKGDLALHLAARAGHVGVVAMLLRVEEEKEGNETQAKFPCLAVNDDGNTALHEAMLYNHKDVANCLIESNIEAAYYVNKQGKSPLYLAVESSEIEYVSSILHGQSENMHLLDEQLTKGRSLMHAAIRIQSIGMPPILIQFFRISRIVIFGLRLLH